MNVTWPQLERTKLSIISCFHPILNRPALHKQKPEQVDLIENSATDLNKVTGTQ